MAEIDLVKNLVKSWIRFDIELQAVETKLLNELASDSAAFQRAQFLYTNVLGNDERRREIALRLAIAEFQETLAQM